MSLDCFHGNGQRLKPQRPIIGGCVFDPVVRVKNCDAFHMLAAERQQGSQHCAGMRCPKAQVGTESKGDVRVGLAVETDVAGRFKRLLVEVRRRPTQGNAVPGFDSDTVNFCLHRADAADVCERHKDPEKFLAGMDDAARVLPQEFE